MVAPHDGSINSRLRMPDNKGHIVPGNSGTNDKKKGMTKKTSPTTVLTDTEQTILDLTRKLNAATRKIEKLEADRKKRQSCVKSSRVVSSPNTRSL